MEETRIFLEPSGLPMAAGVSVLALFLLWANRQSFSGLIRA
jgi:hypothetical protein